MGFDLEATTEDYGRKRWRLRSAFHRLRSKRRKYQTLRAVLDILLNQAEQLEDRRLVEDLQGPQHRGRRYWARSPKVRATGQICWRRVWATRTIASTQGILESQAPPFSPRWTLGNREFSQSHLRSYGKGGYDLNSWHMLAEYGVFRHSATRIFRPSRNDGVPVAGIQLKTMPL